MKATNDRGAPAAHEADARPGVVVTGVSTGIGRAIALELIDAGFQVFGTVRRPEDGEYLAQAGGVALRMDVTRPEEIAAARDAVAAALGGRPLAGVVNNAGVAVCVPWEYVTSEDVRAQLEVNVVGVAAVCQAFLPLLRRSRGRVVMIGSTSHRIPVPLMGPYCASKAAVESMAGTMRREWLRYGVPVVSLIVGPTATPIVEKARETASRRYPEAVEAGAYGAFFDIAADLERDGMPPGRVAVAVRRAMTAKRPPRWRVVSGGRLFTFLMGLLPKGLLDRLYSHYIYGRPARSDGAADGAKDAPDVRSR